MKKEDSLKLSIIVPVYNVEKYLERCVDSLLHQDIDKSEYEIILINDGSTDKSYEIAQQLKNKHGNIVLLSQENKGQGVARNVGIQKARGLFILFVDSDDYLLPDVLKKMLQIADKVAPDILIMQTKSMKEDGSYHQYIPPYDIETIDAGEQILMKGYRPASVWGKLFRRGLILDNSVFFMEGVIHEDVDFILRLFSYAQRVSFSDLCCYVYYWNSLSTDKLMNHDKMMKSYMSDILIADDLKKFSFYPHVSPSLKQFYQCHSNSMTTSLCYALLTRCGKMSYVDKKMLVEKIIAHKLLPISGRTNSRRSDLIAYFLKPRLMKFAIRLLSL